MTDSNIAQPFPYIPATKQSFGNRSMIYGVGINDAPYITQIKRKGEVTQQCPYSLVWMNMFMRVYNHKYHAKQPTYQGTSIDPHWYSFMAFREWMERQDWQGMQLDKDLLVHGNKLYAPDRCVFVTSRVNSLMNDAPASRGQWPVGVHLDKRRGRFMAQCRDGSDIERLGQYDTPEEAHAVYCKRKAEIIKQAANEQPDERVKAALLLRAENLLNTRC